MKHDFIFVYVWITGKEVTYQQSDWFENAFESCRLISDLYYSKVRDADQKIGVHHIPMETGEIYRWWSLCDEVKSMICCLVKPEINLHWIHRWIVTFVCFLFLFRGANNLAIFRPLLVRAVWPTDSTSKLRLRVEHVCLLVVLSICLYVLSYLWAADRLELGQSQGPLPPPKRSSLGMLFDIWFRLILSAYTATRSLFNPGTYR